MSHRNNSKGIEGALSPPFQFTSPSYHIPPDPNTTFTFQQETSDTRKSKFQHRYADAQTIKKGQLQQYKTYLYQLMSKQLMDDGYEQLSKELLIKTMTPPFEHISSLVNEKDAHFEKQPLAELLRDGITYRHESRFNFDLEDRIASIPSGSSATNSGAGSGASHTIGGTSASSNYYSQAAEDESTNAMKGQFVTRFITSHKNPCTCAAFSSDGAFVATGSQDSSLKLLSVEQMHYHTQTKFEVLEEKLTKPVIATYKVHSQDINDVTFHPREPIICSASKDCTIKFINPKTNRKSAFKHIQETHSVKTIGFHPSGEYLLVGTEHHIVRLYNVNNTKCYISSNPSEDHHFSSINCTKFSPDGGLWATSSSDGSIKIWDGTNGRVVKTIPHAHGKGQVFTVMFSKNSRYLLSNGEDGLGKLWDLRTWQQLNVYRPPHYSTQTHHHHITFSYDEKLVIGSHDSNVLLWDSKTATLIEELKGHRKSVGCVSSSPVENAFVSCSDDSRARFYSTLFIGNTK